MRFNNRWITGVLFLFLVSCAVSSKNQANNITIPSVKADTTKKTTTESTKSGLKPYQDVITADALTRKGLFVVHKINDRWLFEIPDQLLNKDILLVTRIERGAANGQSSGTGYSGDQIGQSEIQFAKGPANKIFIRLLSYDARSSDSSSNGMYRTIQASNLQPIQAVFDIKAIQPDSGSCVIDVTDFLNSDNPLLYVDADGKKALGLGGYQKDRSYLSDIQVYPHNVELHSVNTYLRNELPVTYALNTSFVMLPDQPMQPRYFDSRVGYFIRGYLSYDAPAGVEFVKMITRWRIEPKEEDKEGYLRGELVEPKKPIVYYIDPATPKKWVSYLIKGVNDWQRAFEKAGFKNAIYALEVPANDSTFSLFDARHNAIIYKASPIQNASGPQIHDPRTGEILETHINWYHNVQQMLHTWYMVQAAPNDPSARKMIFDESLMGELIRVVCAHEVGHTLGLRHNMGASSTVPTDSLRSKTYLDKNGICPSIMDYARFNYVAQSEDHLTRQNLMPGIGVYDEWAIEWGYRWLPQLKTKEEEMAYMDQWINSRLEKDNRLWWGEGETGPMYIVTDPRIQIEDLGNDAMKASYYGIQNLKRLMSHLKEWAVEPYKGYDGLKKMYDEVIAQYGRYVMHVANNIGNKYWTEKMSSQTGPVVRFIPKEVQKKALKFLANELFDTPDWLYNKDVFALIGGPGDYVYLKAQKSVIDWLINLDNYLTMSWAQMQQPKDAYSYDEFLSDIEDEIWKELKTVSPISFARRNLQKLYTERIIQYSLPITVGESKKIEEKLCYDFYPIFSKHLKSIINRIGKQLHNYKDEKSQLHLMEIKNRMSDALNYTRSKNSYR